MADDADARETPTDATDDTATAFALGDVVHDREADAPNDAIVVNLPSKTADEWVARSGYRGTKTVAEDNPDYPADASTIVVVYADALDAEFPDWDRETPLALTAVNDSEASHYAFPAPRLTKVSSRTAASESASGAATVDENVAASADEETAAADESTASTNTVQEPATSTDSDARSADDVATSPSPAEPVTEADLSASMRALKERLEDGGMTVGIEADGQTLQATKLGDTYRVRPGDVVEGDGALRTRLETIVDEFA